MKTTISGYIAGLMSLLAIVATVPTDLQAMLMALFPKPSQPYVAIIFAFAAFIAKGYQAQNTQDAAKSVPSAPLPPEVLTPKP